MKEPNENPQTLPEFLADMAETFETSAAETGRGATKQLAQNFREALHEVEHMKATIEQYEEFIQEIAAYFQKNVHPDGWPVTLQAAAMKLLFGKPEEKS